MRILIIEDNAVLRHHLSVQLQERKNIVDTAGNAQEAEFFLREYAPDVILVDLGLPGEDGISLIRRWRQTDVRQPILVLTARDGWESKVEALESGADDYVTKPFQLEEVAARLHALVRRSFGAVSQIISIAPFHLDLSRRKLTVNNIEVRLTAFEYVILETLMFNSSRAVSRDNIILKLYQDEGLQDGNSFDVILGRLRKKIHAHYPEDVIFTLRGYGYKFDLVHPILTAN